MGDEVGIANLHRDRPSLQPLAPQAPAHILGERDQRGLEHPRVGDVFVEGVFPGYGFDLLARHDPAQIFSARAMSERLSPFPEREPQQMRRYLGQIAHGVHTPVP